MQARITWGLRKQCCLLTHQQWTDINSSFSNRNADALNAICTFEKAYKKPRHLLDASQFSFSHNMVLAKFTPPDF
jgi:hypothetical protein